MKHIFIFVIFLMSLGLKAQTYGDTIIYTIEKLGNDSIMILTHIWADSSLIAESKEYLDSIKVVNKLTELDSLIVVDSTIVSSLNDRVARFQILINVSENNITYNEILRNKIVYDYIGTLDVGLSDDIFYGYISGTMGVFSLSSSFNQLFYDSEEQRLFIRESNNTTPNCTLFINDIEYTITNGSSPLIGIANNPLSEEGGRYNIKIIMNP